MAPGRAGWQDPVMQRGDDLNFVGGGSLDPIGPDIWFKRTYRSSSTTSSVSISTTVYTDVDLSNCGTARSCWVFRWFNYHLFSLVSLCGEQLRVNHYVKSYWFRDQEAEYLTFKETDLRYPRSVRSRGMREVIYALILLASTTIWYSCTATRRSQLICYWSSWFFQHPSSERTTPHASEFEHYYTDCFSLMFFLSTMLVSI